MKKFFVIILIVATYLISSCSKLSNEPNATPDDNLKTASYKQPVLSAAQIDSVGLMHNVLLQQFLNEVNADSMSTNHKREVERIIKETECMNFFQDYRFGLYQFVQGDSILVDLQVLRYFEKLSTLLNSNLTVSSTNDSIAVLCFDANQDQTLSLDQQQQILIFCSIAKHSNYFWSTKSLGGSGIGELYLSKLHDKKSVRAWQNIAGADAFGGLAGGIGWCGAAVFGGPVGVAGFIGNILWGAASSSLTAWALEQ